MKLRSSQGSKRQRFPGVQTKRAFHQFNLKFKPHAIQSNVCLLSAFNRVLSVFKCLKVVKMQSFRKKMAVKKEKYSNIRDFYENFKFELGEEDYLEEDSLLTSSVEVKEEAGAEDVVVILSDSEHEEENLDPTITLREIEHDPGNEFLWLEEIQNDEIVEPKPKLKRGRKPKIKIDLLKDSVESSEPGSSARSALMSSSITNKFTPIKGRPGRMPKPLPPLKFICALCQKGSNKADFLENHTAEQCRRAQMHAARVSRMNHVH
jgi:hypothetical protein